MYGLVLQGGGGKGSYQIGVWKALRELDIDIVAVTGTSIGALNGALIAQDMFDEAVDMWINMDPSKVFNVNSDLYNELMNFQIDFDNMHKYFEYFRKVYLDGGLDTKPLQQLIDRLLDEDKLRNSKIDFGLVTVNLTEMKAMELFVEDIPRGKVNEYLLASAFLPGFKPEELDGKRFVDGGVYDNLPVNLISSKGYKNLITVEMKSIGMKQRIKDKDVKITKIVPSGDIGLVLEIDPERARKNINLGYLDTLKVFGNLEGRRYFLKNIPDDDYFFDRFNGLEDDKIMSIAGHMGYSKGNPRRLLFEKLIPEIIGIFGAKQEDSYRDIFVLLLEYLAAQLEVDRLRSYDYQDFEDMVIRKSLSYHKSHIDYDKIPDILKKSNLVKFSLREELLTKCIKIFVS